MKGPAPRTLLCAGSLALLVLGAELGLRLAGHEPLADALDRSRLVRPSRAPGRVYELVPGAGGAAFGTSVSVNAHGFRGAEVALAADGRRRIVALGDSVTFGNDLALAETWPALLERELRASGEPVDVLNLALGGYDSAQEVATLEALGLAFEPEQVVLGYCVNDVGVVSMALVAPFAERDRANPLYASRLVQWLRARAAERARRRALFERNREESYARAYAAEIEPLASEVVPLVEALRAAVAGTPLAEEELAARRIPPRWYASEARLGRLQHVLERLAALASAHGFEVTVLLVPYLEDDPLIERGLEIVRVLAELRGFDVVDPREAFLAEGLASLRLRAEDPVHPNARGHRLLAEALLPRLALVARD